MPRVSAEHLAARREQIIDAAMSRFAVNGFQATGMADVIAASGLSAGAVYRYFTSKDELIEAIADRVLNEIASRLDAGLTRPEGIEPAAAVWIALEAFEEYASAGPVDVSRIAIQAWAEALRNERIADIARSAYTRIRSYFVEVCRQAQAAGTMSADADASATGAALYSLVAGYVLQRNLLGDVPSDAYAAGAGVLLAGPTR